jgi:hypothetical protein
MSGKGKNGKFYKGSIGQSFDRGKSISVCKKIHGNGKRPGESAVENKKEKVKEIYYIYISFGTE